MRAFIAAYTFQTRLTWKSPDTLQVCLTAPLLTLIFLAISENASRGDLAAYGVIAPTLMSLWTIVLLFAGQIITEERNRGNLEGLVAVPAPLAVVVLGRLAAVASVSLVAFAEAWLIGGLVFHTWITVYHPVLFGLSIVSTALAMVGTAFILSPLFVLFPSARIIQNTLSYPFYLLGGVIVPVALLPGWLQPVTRIVFLSWASDLLRSSLASGSVHYPAGRLLAVIALGVAGCGVGLLLLNRILWHVRHNGTISQT